MPLQFRSANSLHVLQAVALCTYSFTPRTLEAAAPAPQSSLQFQLPQAGAWTPYVQINPLSPTFHPPNIPHAIPTTTPLMLRLPNISTLPTADLSQTAQAFLTRQLFNFQPAATARQPVPSLVAQEYQRFKTDIAPQLNTMSADRQLSACLSEVCYRAAFRTADIDLQNQLLEVGKGTTQIALGFSPAGDAIDFYEVIVGKDIFGATLSTPERVLSAAGLVVGSGALYRAVGNEASLFFRNISDLNPEALVRFKAGEEIFDALNGLPSRSMRSGLFPDTLAKTFVDGRFEVKVITEDLDLFRYFGAGRGNPKEYSFFTSTYFETGEEASKHLGLVRGQEKFLEPFFPTHVATYRIPKGTQVMVGRVAEIPLANGEILSARAPQIVVTGASRSWKLSTNPVPLKK